MRRDALLDDITTLCIRLSKNGTVPDERLMRASREVGGDSRDRTGDLRLAKPALSQLSYIPSAADPGGPRKI